MRQRQQSWEQQRLYSTKNPLMGKTLGNPYGNRGVPAGNGHSSSTYSGDGVGYELYSFVLYFQSNAYIGNLVIMWTVWPHINGTVPALVAVPM